VIDEHATEFIDAPVSEVFHFMSRVETLPQWLEGCKKSWAVSDDPYRVGAEVAHIDQVMGQTFEAHFKVAVWDRDSRMVFKALDGPFVGTSDERFRPEGSGTRVDIYVKGELRGAFKLGEWAAKKVARKQLQRSVENAKRILESPPAEASR
jgi:carbon monoxide dehydrogenase subunit G